MASNPNADPKEAAKNAAGQYLTFSLNGEIYAMDSNAVREIIQCVGMTAVPLMPSFVRGVINLRGSVVPVIDLQSRLGGHSATSGKKTCIIIFDMLRDGERTEMGLLVESVSKVVTILNREIEPTPPFGGGLRRDFIRGMAKLMNRFIVILDTSKALDIEEMAGLVEMALKPTPRSIGAVQLAA